MFILCEQWYCWYNLKSIEGLYLVCNIWIPVYHLPNKYSYISAFQKLPSLKYFPQTLLQLFTSLFHFDTFSAFQKPKAHDVAKPLTLLLPERLLNKVKCWELSARALSFIFLSCWRLSPSFLRLSETVMLSRMKTYDKYNCCNSNNTHT